MLDDLHDLCDVDKPNIVYLFTDQLRGDSLGYSSGGEVVTPNFDDLANKSVRFNRCISNSPLCVPARASLMTGMLPRENGVWSNRKGVSPTAPSHVRNIREAGYTTAVIGKTHLWRTGAGPKPGMHSSEKDDVLAEWGFDYRVEVNDPIGTGSMGCAYTDYLEEIDWIEPHRRYIKNWITELRSGNPTSWAQEPSPVPQGDDIDSFIGRSAVRWLESYEQETPFYLKVQFTAPHDPYDGPHRYKQFYDADELDVGVTDLPLNNALDRVNARYRLPNAVMQATAAQRQRWRVNYYANISLIDCWIGELVDALEGRDLASNTWIILTSDHGEMLGELGLMGKTFYYEPPLCVPFLLHSPNDVSGEANDLVEHVDIPATLLIIAGAQSFVNSSGRSILPFVMPSDGYRHKEFVVSELFGETTMVTDRYRLTTATSANEPLQLLDSREDTTERTNLVHMSCHRTTIEDLLGCIKQIDDRLNRQKLDEYERYVQQTGSLN